MFGCGTKVKVLTVTNFLISISTTNELARKHSSIYKDREKQTYTLNIQQMIEGFRLDDPPVIPQLLVVPIAVPNLCYYTVRFKNGSPKAETVGYLSLIAFYFVGRHKYASESCGEKGDHSDPDIFFL